MSLEQLFNFTQVASVISTPLPEFLIPTNTQQTQGEGVLSAHETLMGLSERNKQDFKGVVELLQEALRR